MHRPWAVKVGFGLVFFPPLLNDSGPVAAGHDCGMNLDAGRFQERCGNFLVREELRPKPIFSKSKDIFWVRGRSTFQSLLPWEMCSGGGTRLYILLLCCSCGTSAFFTNPVTHPRPGEANTSSMEVFVSRNFTSQQFRSTSQRAK